MTIESQILDAAASLDSFTVTELMKILGGTLSLERVRFNWYLARLAEDGKIVRVSRGTYMVSGRAKVYMVSGRAKVFRPEPGPKAAGLYRKFREEFPQVGICVYEGQWLFQFMHHLASNQVTYIEVEKDIAETVFHRLRDEGETVFLRPDADLIYKYVNMDGSAVFVKHLTSESPLQTVSEIKVPTLEKLLVDMYCDPDFFYLQGAEYNRIMHNARSRYVINLSRLSRYAHRRNVARAIQIIYESSEYDID